MAITAMEARGESKSNYTIYIQTSDNLRHSIPIEKKFLVFYRNWYVFNPHNTRFEDYGLYMQRGHNRADFTRIPEDAAMLRNCKLN